MIKLSIITINYNNLSGLRLTMDSVLKQTYTNIEYIVIDGDSTDGSKDLIREYSDKLSYWVSEKDGGIYNAMNKGVSKAKGEYCLFLNSDDYLVHERVLEQLFKLNFTEDIVYGDMYMEDSMNTKTLSVQPQKLTFEHFISSTLWHPASFIKTALFFKYGFYNEQLKIVSDYEFFLKTIIVNQVSYKHVDMAISVYKVVGMSSKKENEELHLLERKKVQEMYFPISVIETAKKLEALNGSKVIKVYSWLQKHPGILKVISRFSSIFGKR